MFAIRVGLKLSPLQQCIIKRGLKKIGILGVPFGKGQDGTGDKLKGLEEAPKAIRELGIKEKLCTLGYKVKDYGDVCYRPLAESKTIKNMRNFNHIAPHLEQISLAVRSVLQDKKICLTLGGDHSLATGTIHGHLKVSGPENVAVIYIDAHADINTLCTSETSNVHGMPLALVAKELEEHWPEIPDLDWLHCKLPLKNLGYIGLRDVDPPEARFIEQFDIASYDMSKVDELGIENTVQSLLERIDPDKSKSLHVSIDVDSMDPLEAPSTTKPVRGGLTLREVIRAVEKLASTGRIRAVDLVEFNPLLGSNEDIKKTEYAVEQVLLACFGNSRGGNAQIGDITTCY